MIRKIIIRSYQTKTGVFGHLPKAKRIYKIPDEALKQRAANSNLYRFITAYREHGHKKADINPIALSKADFIPELDPKLYDLKLDQRVNFKGLIKSTQEEGTVQDVIHFLEEKYCKHIGCEMSHLPTEEYEWLSERVETLKDASIEKEKNLMIELLKSQVFDRFLAVKFNTLKRYGGEGSESMMAAFYQLIESCQQKGVTVMVIGMPHRGRLNLLTGLLKQPPALIFRKIKGFPEFPATAQATGDVLSHLTCSVDVGSLHVTMLPNPSHLEAVNPVSMGKTRAKQMMTNEGCYGSGTTLFGEKIINVQVHGDAAFAGQGVNQETLLLGGVPHFTVGGSVHVIVNNQLGFTTPPDRGRSTRYASDLAKMISAPVLHVHGDFPDKVAQVTDIALDYQRNFRKDVFIDINCYRQWGHNELDDPTFTNPATYQIIFSRRGTVPDLYSEKLINKEVVSAEYVEDIKKEYYEALNIELKNENSGVKECYFQKQWKGITQAGENLTIWDTGLDTNLLRFIGVKSVQYPENFNVHKHLLKTHINGRLKKMRSADEKIDWATAESLAIGSLLYQGYNVRISGQDVGRGTFSQRHAMFVDQKTNDIFVPLNHIADGQVGKLEVANSPLSEEAVLGFEYGMSIENPNNLIIWEAQFGDFFNGAQIIIDTFVTSGEIKWMKCSGLVMLLPHGYDGAGPEHSSSRIERFLQLSDSKESAADGDSVNIQVVYPTTPAQYFHLLRNQMIRNYRKPLIVIGPKTLLRLPEAVSSWSEFDTNTNFQNIISDNPADTSKIKTIIFTSGKHFYNLDKVKAERNISDTIIVRIESLCPFPTHELQKLSDKYSNARIFIWSQEEPRNMGAWNFIQSRFRNLVGLELKYVGPEELGTPALVGQKHFDVQKRISENVFQ